MSATQAVIEDNRVAIRPDGPSKGRVAILTAGACVGSPVDVVA